MADEKDEKKAAEKDPGLDYKFGVDQGGNLGGYSFGLGTPSAPAMDTSLPDWFTNATAGGATPSVSSNVAPGVAPGVAVTPAPVSAPQAPAQPAVIDVLLQEKAQADAIAAARAPQAPASPVAPQQYTPPQIAVPAPVPAPAPVPTPAPAPTQASAPMPSTPVAIPTAPIPRPATPAPPMPVMRRDDSTGTRPVPLNLAADQRFSGLTLPDELNATVERIFSLNDLDFNGYVDFQEITKMLEGDELTTSEKQFVLMIYQVGKKLVTEKAVIDESAVPVMSKSDFKLAFASILKNVMPNLTTPHASPSGAAVGQPFRPSVYAEDDYPLGSIKAQAVRLGTMGDAYFAAALVSLIDMHPRGIMRMVNNSADQSFRIMFPGLHGKGLDLLPPRAEEIMHYGIAQQYGFWYPLLEKAYGMYVAQHHKLASSFEHGKEALARISQAIEALTGSTTDWTATNLFTPEDLRAYVLEILSKGRIMVAISADNISQASTIAGAAPIPNKPYAVQGYDQNTHKMIVRGVGTVNTANLDESVLRLSIEQFAQYFKAVYYQVSTDQTSTGSFERQTLAPKAQTNNPWRKLPNE